MCPRHWFSLFSLFFITTPSQSISVCILIISPFYTRAHSFSTALVDHSVNFWYDYSLHDPSGSANSTWHGCTEEFWACAPPSTRWSRRWTGGRISEDCTFGEEQGASCEFQQKKFFSRCTLCTVYRLHKMYFCKNCFVYEMAILSTIIKTSVLYNFCNRLCLLGCDHPQGRGNWSGGGC